MPETLYGAERVVMAISRDRPCPVLPRGRAGLRPHRITSKFAPLTTVRNWQRVPVSKNKDASVSRRDVDGTSANHVLRKTLLEPHPMGAALDAIKLRYGFEGSHLAGQSGSLVTGLAGTRHDIACAASGSGRLGISGGGSSKKFARTLVDPLGFDMSIPHNRAVHFLMISDSADRSVPAGQQTPFAEKLRRAGHRIPQYFVTATDDLHHSIVSYAELVTARCALGKSDRVATPVGTPVKRNAACDEQRRQEIALLGKNGTARPSAEPGAGHPARSGGKRA
jgi:hypothetical protein